MLQLKKKILIGTLSLVFEKPVSNNDRANLDVNHLVAITHGTYSELFSCSLTRRYPFLPLHHFVLNFPLPGMNGIWISRTVKSTQG